MRNLDQPQLFLILPPSGYAHSRRLGRERSEPATAARNSSERGRHNPYGARLPLANVLPTHDAAASRSPLDRFFFFLALFAPSSASLALLRFRLSIRCPPVPKAAPQGTCWRVLILTSLRKGHPAFAAALWQPPPTNRPAQQASGSPPRAYRPPRSRHVVRHKGHAEAQTTLMQRLNSKTCRG